MEAEKATASGSRTITQDELKALLELAEKAKREQENMVLTSTETMAVAHWGNTDYGRIAGTGLFVMFVCFGLATLCAGVSLILDALR